MGRSRLVSRGLTLVAILAVAACGREAELLATMDTDKFFSGAGGAGKYKPKSMDAAVRGTIAGVVKFEGRAYTVKAYSVSTDNFCAGAHPDGLKGEDFRYDAATGGLEGAIVYVKKGLNSEKWETPTDPVVLDQKGCQYTPHVVVVQTGQPLVIKSSDPTLHNVDGRAGPNRAFNEAMSRPGELAPKYFTKPEMAKKIICGVHGWMSAYVAAVPHPCWAITEADGTFTVPGVPPGTYLLAAWHENLGEVEAEVVLDANGTVNHVFTFERK